jgi:hypothetical protein
MTEMKKVTLTKAEIEKMEPQEFADLIMRAHKVEAKAVVRRADGSIKYDNPELAGQYGEEHLDECGPNAR